MEPLNRRHYHGCPAIARRNLRARVWSPRLNRPRRRHQRRYHRPRSRPRSRRQSRGPSCCHLLAPGPGPSAAFRPLSARELER
eukprot:scaffold71728_cov75-Phaeocystis_antarctica.AAC.1